MGVEVWRTAQSLDTPHSPEVKLPSGDRLGVADHVTRPPAIPSVVENELPAASNLRPGEYEAPLQVLRLAAQ